MSYRVYFGRLPESLSQDDFEKMISEHGKAKNIEWKAGYAYVDYKHGSDAANTVEKMNGKEIEGNNILVELARNGAGGFSVAGGFSTSGKPLPRPVRTPYRVRIENLSTRAKWMELKELLSIAGEVTFADTHKRKQGEGIVEFGSKRDMKEAINMFDKTIFFGKTIRLYDESLIIDYRNRRSRSPPRRHVSPRRRRSRSRSNDRKRSDRKSSSQRVRSKSSSPRRKSDKQKRSKSRSASPSRRASKKQRSDSASPKRSKSSQKKSRKSRSPKREKKSEKSKKSRKRSSSHSSSDNKNDLKQKSKTGRKKRNSTSGSSSSSASESDGK